MLHYYHQNDIKQHQETIMEEMQKQVLIRLPEEVLKALDADALANRRSRAAQVTVILEERYKLESKTTEQAA
jgi:hypothetical protein